MQQWRDGDQAALDELTPLVYDKLRRLAASYLRREREGHTLQDKDWKSRAHFFGVAAHLMRQILVDHARDRNRDKRGAGVAKVQFNEALDASQERPKILVQLDDALNELETLTSARRRS